MKKLKQLIASLMIITLAFSSPMISLAERSDTILDNNGTTGDGSLGGNTS